jgi:ATP diphosphatase
MEELLEIMRRLRDPETGCPWDVEQDFSTIAPYTIEEAYEVADAIEREDYRELREELGDLLLQVVFHAQMADEAGLFDFREVAQGIGDKLVRRHAHVFGDTEVESADAQLDNWEQAKARERRDKGVSSLMDGVPRGLPELLRAEKLQKRAAEAGFDWASAEPVMDKFREELAEITEAIESGDKIHIEDELGDLMFNAVNLARKLKIDAGRALRHANAKFEGRFRAIERAAGGTAALAAMDLDAQEALWQQVKKDGTERGL